MSVNKVPGRLVVITHHRLKPQVAGLWGQLFGIYSLPGEPEDHTESNRSHLRGCDVTQMMRSHRGNWPKRRDHLQILKIWMPSTGVQEWEMYSKWLTIISTHFYCHTCLFTMTFLFQTLHPSFHNPPVNHPVDVRVKLLWVWVLTDRIRKPPICIAYAANAVAFTLAFLYSPPDNLTTYTALDVWNTNHTCLCMQASDLFI